MLGSDRCFCLEDLGSSGLSSLSSDYELPCGCRCHTACFENYCLVRVREFRSKSATFTPCPYGESCKAHDVEEKGVLGLSLEDLEHFAIQLSVGRHVSPLNEQLSGLREWLALDHENSSIFFSLSDSDKARKLDELDPYVLATTKPCPKCAFRSSKYHGHGCHHAFPGGGCPSCHINYCYKCLSTEVENLEERLDPAKCKCGFWGSFCAPLRSAKDISMFIETKPVPHDRRCGCIICPDCCFNQPCESCPGNCIVCLGYVNPGPRDLSSEYTLQIPGGFFESLTPGKKELMVLQEACNHGDVEACRRVLVQLDRPSSFNINAKDPEGYTCIHLAVNSGNYDCVELVLQLAPELDINMANNDGYTPFITACKTGILQIVKLLASTGRIDVNSSTGNGYTALFVSCCNGLVETTDYLLKHDFRPALDINKADHTGYTPFLIAARNGHLKIVEMLLDQNNLDIIRVSRYGSSARQWAAKNNHKEIVKAIDEKMSTFKQSFLFARKSCSTS